MKNTLLKKGSTMPVESATETDDCSNCCFKMSTLSSNKLINNNNNNSQRQGHQALLQSVHTDHGASKDGSGNKKKRKKMETTEIRTFYKKLLKNHKGLLVLGAVGVLLVGLATTLLLLDPLAIVTTTMLTFYKGSYMYRMWVKPPIEVYVKVYIFNVTNHEEFTRGGVKLKLQELGPFVYKEELEHHNVTMNVNNTVTYTPKRVVTEMPDMGVPGLTMQSRIIVPNLPLLGFTSMLANSSMFLNLALLSLTNYLDIQPFLELTVEEYLWGYDEPLIKMASRIAPKWITFERLGLLDRMFDDGINVVTMSLDNEPRVNDEGRVLKPVTIDQYNGSPGMEHWGYEGEDNTTHKECNTLQGIATEGVFLHRGITKNDTFVIYRKAFCRTLRLVFDHDGVTKSGLPAYWYKLPDDVFDNTNPENSCYCQPDQGPCLPNGLSDVTPCYYNIPAAASLPHFYNSDPSLWDRIEGLAPDKKKHATEVVVQPKIGIPLQIHSRIQTNIVVKNVKYHKRVLPFVNMTVPLFWADLCLDELPPSMNDLLSLLLRIAPVIQTTVILVFGLAGATMLLVAITKSMCSVRLTNGRQPVSMWTDDYASVRLQTDKPRDHVSRDSAT